MARDAWLHIALLHCLTVPTALASSDVAEFTLGIYGPFTSFSQSFLAGAVAFDLDFRKNSEPDLVTRLGPPIVQIENLHPSLRVNTLIGTSNSDPETGMRMALDWFLGNAPFPKIDGIIGGFHSAIAMPIASLSAVFGIPQVAWGASSPTLSDKVQYPYFVRTFPPDSFQGSAMWAWMVHFQIPSVAFFYVPDDSYANGLYQATLDAASTASQGFRIIGVSIAYMPNPETYDLALAEKAVQDVKNTGSRFIILAMGRTEATSAMYVMEQQGMLYSGEYQLLGCESVAAMSRLLLNPSHGLPAGFQQFLPVTAGPLFPKFAEMWTNMTTEDVYGADARARYMLDSMRVTLEESSAPMLTASDFLSTDTLDPLVTFIFDAGYTFVLAINDLLNGGVSPGDIHGEVLLEQIRQTLYDGITGTVSFNAQGDRVASYQLWNSHNDSAGSTTLVHVGDYVSLTGMFELSSDPVWVSGEALPLPPQSLLDCLFGFERDATTNMCTPCRPGIGCGYRPEEGFPIGIFGPFTSLDQDILGAAVLFDLDFRKNADPDLRARFGEPIVTIPNLHPDLKIKTQLGTSDSRVSIGMETTLEWFLGVGDWYKVAGIVGGYHSAIAGPVASTAAVFEVPQVSWGATSPSLSDKILYPWFVRTIPPDSLQGSAMWAWMNQFGVPSVAYLHSRESYGEGLFQTTSDLAATADQPNRVSGVGMQVMIEGEYDVDVALEACDRIKSTNSKFVMMAFSGAAQATLSMYAMELKDMLNSYQILGTEGVDVLPSLQYAPSRGLPVGFMKFQPVTRGALYDQFVDMWKKMTPNDVYGVEATRRYMLDHFLVLPSQGARPMLTESDFQSDPWFLTPFVVDAAYTFVFAINDLLNAGVSVHDIHGQILLEKVKATTFTGVTGGVAYDENSDRVGDYELFNLVQGASVYVPVATWSAGTNLFTFSTSMADRLTWVGGTISSSAPEELIACAAGQLWDENAGLCIFCPINFWSSGGAGSEARCVPCDAGTVGNAPFGATGCIECTNGTFRTIGDETCVQCPLGKYGHSMGQSECEECYFGEYAPQVGLTACEICGANRSSVDRYTTMYAIVRNGQTEYSPLQAATSVESCGCDRNARLDPAGECVACGEGTECKGMNDVHILQGYYAALRVNNDLSVYQCHGDHKRCSGGLPGQTCAQGRTGITCAECMEGMTPKSGGECVECGGNDRAPFIVVVIVGILLLIFTYHLIDTQNRATQSHALLLCAIAVGQLITVTQQLGVVGMLSMDFEEPINSFMKFLGLLAFNVEVIRFNCVSSQGPVERFSMKVFIITITIALMLLIHVMFVFIKHKGAFKERTHTLVGAIGSMFMVFYIAVTSTVLEPLQCQGHPNDKWTVRMYPGVICWSTSDHTMMLIIGTLAFFAVPVAYLVGCIFIVRQFPKRMQAGDVAFLKAYSFLFFRFRSSQHTYVIAQMLRSFLVACVLVVPDSVVQVFTLEIVLLLSLCATLWCLPWRVMQANMLDGLLGGGTLLVVCMVSFFLSDGQKSLRGIAWMSLTLISFLLALIPLAVGYGIYRKFFRRYKPFQFFLCHHKAGAGAYTRMLKMHLLDHPKVVSSVFVDSDNLDNLDRLFDYVGNDTGTLCCICSEQLFTRAWCVGEMCTAHLKKVTVVLVMLPTADLPDDFFIEELEERVSNMEILTESGMSFQMLADAIHWIVNQPQIKVPDVVNPKIMNNLVDRLVQKDATDVLGPDSKGLNQKSMQASKCASMLYDLSNTEAAATAWILKKLLLPHFAHDTSRVPEPMESPTLPESTQTVCVICTQGVFENNSVLKVLLKLPDKSPVLLPVICEQAFRFPSRNMGSQLQGSLPLGIGMQDANVIGIVVQALFKEIAINFVAQHAGEANLRLAAEDVAKRLANTGKSSTMQNSMVGLAVRMQSSASDSTLGGKDGTSQDNSPTLPPPDNDEVWSEPDLRFAELV